MLPRRRACQAHFEWDQVSSFPNSIACVFIKHAVLELSFLLFHFCLFFRGGLGVVEKPTRGELVRSTHRVPSPFIFLLPFIFETFLARCDIYGVGNGLWLMALSSPLCIIRLC